MSPRCKNLGMLAMLLSLCACSSAPPVRHYTLLAPSSVPAVSELRSSYLIDVLPVGLPVQYEQPQLVVRQGESAMLVLENERWISPMADEVRAALSAALSQRLGARDVAGLPRPAGTSVVKIQLQVRRLDAWPGQRVELDADWSLSLSPSKLEAERAVCSTRLTLPAPGGYPELVGAQQAAIQALAEKMAAATREWMSTRKTSCALT